MPDRTALPQTLLGYILQVSRRHQLALWGLSVVVFLLSAAPLEIQRRIVNDAIRTGSIDAVALLALAYFGLALAEGAVKLCLNVYRAWVSERAVLDLRHEETIFAVNRFMIYALFPQTNISIHVLWGVQKQNTVFATGKSITNRSSKTNIGELMLSYGGGGHENAGTCQVENDQADAVLQKLVTKINADG